eukprot:gene7251-14787_t
MSVISIFGATFDRDLYFSRHIMNRIVNKGGDFNIEFEELLEIDYLARIKELQISKGGGFYSHQANHCVLRDGEYIGDITYIISLATNQYGIEDAEICNISLFEKMGMESTLQALKASGHAAVFLEIGKDATEKPSDPIGKIVIELFTDLCPKACENFTYLCTGQKGRDVATQASLDYCGTPFHRLVKGGWIQGGDIIDGSGNQSLSAMGAPFEDECFSVDFGCKAGGIVGYASKSPHSNGSQFFVTLGPCAWMNCTKVGFGRVIQGYSVLKEIGNWPCTNERPNPDLVIRSCVWSNPYDLSSFVIATDIGSKTNVKMSMMIEWRVLGLELQLASLSFPQLYDVNHSCLMEAELMPV